MGGMAPGGFLANATMMAGMTAEAMIANAIIMKAQIEAEISKKGWQGCKDAF